MPVNKIHEGCKIIPEKLTSGDLLIDKYDEDLQTGYKIVINKTSSGGVEFECHSDYQKWFLPLHVLIRQTSIQFNREHERRQIDMYI